MEKDSASLRRRTTRTARESTPEPSLRERTSKSSDRETKTRSTGDDSKYIVRGILNVGPPSPAGSSSSSGSGGHGGGVSGGSSAYRAKLLRYFTTSWEMIENRDEEVSSSSPSSTRREHLRIFPSNSLNFQFKVKRRKAWHKRFTDRNQRRDNQRHVRRTTISSAT